MTASNLLGRTVMVQDMDWDREKCLGTPSGAPWNGEVVAVSHPGDYFALLILLTDGTLTKRHVDGVHSIVKVI